MSESQRLRLRATDLEWREVEGEILALDLKRSHYSVVNPAGQLLWRGLARGATREELVHVLTGHYEIGPDQARADVEAFLGELAERGLLERASSATSP